MNDGARGNMAVLLLAHGSPDSPADVPEFMRHITGGRPVSDAVLEEVRHRYSLIGKSPLTEITLAQAQALRSQMDVPIFIGMRNWKPFIADTVEQMMESGVQRVLAICLAPQNSSTSVGLYKTAMMAHMKPGIDVHFVESWHNHPLLVRAFAEKLQCAWQRASAEAGAPVPVIYTAHSVPTHTIQAGDPYEWQARETARLVGEQVHGLTSGLQHFAFQSQGMSGGPWLGPTVESVIIKVRQQGFPGVILAPIGFLCDHVEMIYDVDIGFKQFAAEQNLKFWRTESLNDSPALIAALAALASEKIALAFGQPA